jgi:hypothetical protein
VLDTCVYIDELQGRPPAPLDELLETRIVNHSTVCLAELTHLFGRLDPDLGEAGMLAGMVSRVRLRTRGQGDPVQRRQPVFFTRWSGDGASWPALHATSTISISSCRRGAPLLRANGIKPMSAAWAGRCRGVSAEGASQDLGSAAREAFPLPCEN